MNATVIIIIIFVLAVIWYLYNRYNIGNMYLLHRRSSKYAAYKRMLKDFEKQMSHWYPIGNDEFRIDHGNDYYAFFERMGKLYMQVVVKDNKIIATGAGVLRKIRGQKVFYLCDCKVDKPYRNRWLPFRMLAKSANLANITDTCYCISMNNGNEENKMVRLLSRVDWIIPFKYAGNLLIYSLNADDIQYVKHMLEGRKGSLYFVSLLGKKDLILRSTNRPMKLYHVNFSKNIDNVRLLNDVSYDIEPDATYMFCFHEHDPIVDLLRVATITTNVTASIIEHGLSHLRPDEWDFIQTSEI